MAKIYDFVTRAVLHNQPYDEDYRRMKDMERAGFGYVTYDQEALTERFVWTDVSALVYEGFPPDVC